MITVTQLLQNTFSDAESDSKGFFFLVYCLHYPSASPEGTIELLPKISEFVFSSDGTHCKSSAQMGHNWDRI